MLAYLGVHKSFVSYVYMYETAYIMSQLHRLHLEKLFIQQQHDLNPRHLFYNYSVSTSDDIY